MFSLIIFCDFPLNDVMEYLYFGEVYDLPHERIQIILAPTFAALIPARQLGRFASSGFALCAHILGRFTPSSFVLCIRILSHFAPCGFVLYTRFNARALRSLAPLRDAPPLSLK